MRGGDGLREERSHGGDGNRLRSLETLTRRVGFLSKYGKRKIGDVEAGNYGCATRIEEG
jgi:hypothetical protein